MPRITAKQGDLEKWFADNRFASRTCPACGHSNSLELGLTLLRIPPKSFVQVLCRDCGLVLLFDSKATVL